MKFKQGDKVAFLNEKQNGVIIKTTSTGKVIVEIEDGFEIEADEKELVKIGTVLTEQERADEPVKVGNNESPSSLLERCTPGSICFCSVPAATGAVLTGVVNYYLINNSEFDALFTVHLRKNKKWEGLSMGILQKLETVFLSSFKREELTDVESFFTEALLFHKLQRPTVNHIRKETGVMLPGITETHRGLTGVTAFARVTELYNGKEPEPLKMNELIEKMNSGNTSPALQKKMSPSNKYTPDKFGVLINEKIIDLHIEELTQHFSGLSNAEMLAIQMKKFTEEMDIAIKNHYKRLVFIHGVGNGVLKREIRNELRNYDVSSIQDGEFIKFGYGATEVIF